STCSAWPACDQSGHASALSWGPQGLTLAPLPFGMSAGSPPTVAVSHHHQCHRVMSPGGETLDAIELHDYGRIHAFTNMASRLVGCDTCQSPARLVGNTPVLWVPDLLGQTRNGFWAKIEGANPGGIKDRPALHMIIRARERGELAPGSPIIESTSGTLGLGLLLAGISYGHPATLVTDPGLEPLMANLLRAHGARVDVVPAPHPVGGWQEARRQRVRELRDRHPGAYCPDQYHNPDNVAAYG